MKKIGKKIRLNLLLDKRAYNIIEDISKFKRISKGKIIDSLIIQKLSDPIKNLKNEKRELAIKMNEIDDKLKELEEYDEQKTKQFELKKEWENMIITEGENARQI